MNPKLRLAHVTATFPPYFSGTGNVCYHNTLELARRGHQVTIFTAAGDRIGAGIARNIQVERLKPILRTGNAPLLPQLYSRLTGFDIIHLHYPFFGGESAALAARRNRTPLVITYHQDVLLNGLTGLVEKALRPTLSRWVLRSASRMLFTSLDYGGASHARRLLRGRETAIDELPNGVDPVIFSPSDKTVANPPSGAHYPSTFNLLLVATLDKAHYFKGIPILLEALAGIPAASPELPNDKSPNHEWPNFQLIIVGEGDMRSTYEEQAEALGLSPKVKFTGRVTDETLPDYYRQADVTLLPSTTMGEAFGLVLVESLACGTPVIASNLPGVRTVVNDGVDGFLVQPGDPADLRQKILRMANLPAPQRQAMGAAGRKKVQNCYSWEHLAERLEAIYYGVISGENLAERS